jgi:hypothetical protein
MEILTIAGKYIAEDRAITHGDARTNLTTIAALWQTYLDTRHPSPLTPADVAVLMVLLKVARQSTNPEHLDNYLDIVGWGSLAGEMQTETVPRRDEAS